MAEIKVSQLPEASQINDADLLMIVQGGENKKITKENCQFASGDEIFVGDEPSGGYPESIKLVIEDDDALVGEGSYISNEYGTSQTIGYSQEYLNGVVLYNDNSGTSLSIQLSDSLANYKKIGIECINSSSVVSYNEYIEPNNKILSAVVSRSNAGALVVWNREFECSGNTISTSANRWARSVYTSSSTGISNNQDATDLIAITKVIGYK